MTELNRGSDSADLREQGLPQLLGTEVKLER